MNNKKKILLNFEGVDNIGKSTLLDSVIHLTKSEKDLGFIYSPKLDKSKEEGLKKTTFKIENLNDRLHLGLNISNTNLKRLEDNKSNSIFIDRTLMSNHIYNNYLKESSSEDYNHTRAIETIQNYSIYGDEHKSILDETHKKYRDFIDSNEYKNVNIILYFSDFNELYNGRLKYYPDTHILHDEIEAQLFKNDYLGIKRINELYKDIALSNKNPNDFEFDNIVAIDINKYNMSANKMAYEILNNVLK